MRMTTAEYDLTKEKVDKINARAVKRGFTGRLELTGKPETWTRDLPSGLKVTVSGMDAEITGTPPKYDGWTFLARLEFDRDSGLIVFTAPGVTDPVDRTCLREGACDHCETSRYRKNVYLLRNEEGKTIQVGSTCIRDFLGWDTMPVFLSEDDAKITIEGGYGHTEPTYDVLTVLAAAWAVIQKRGFVRANDYGYSTKSAVMDVLDPRTKQARELSAEISPLIPEAVRMATVIRDFVLSDDFRGGSDYVPNLKNICRGENVKMRMFGYLVSAPQAWAREQERTLIRQREEGKITNEWVGQIKDKVTLDVTVKSFRYIDNGWGSSVLYTMTDSDGHVIKWFSTNGALGEDDETIGKEFKITGTVKKHEEYNGRKSTVLTRCKVNA